ncbi:MAG: response regulator transcription factor [Clostridia bacterium]|nr:response regulator transcription factor [Clostridia bacterium]
MPIHLIVAEDFDLLREDLCETINAQADMEVVGEAASGAALVALAREKDFDVALVDIEMEHATAGICAAEIISKEKPQVRIIFLTAHETENMILMSMAAGAVDYIVKGGAQEEILQHIRAAYQDEPMLDARVQQTVLKEYSRLRRSEASLLFFTNNVGKLTLAEKQLVRCLLQGYKVKEIAQLRSVEVVTVKTQIKGLLRKFGCSRTKEIVEMIHQLGVEQLF